MSCDSNNDSEDWLTIMVSEDDGFERESNEGLGVVNEDTEAAFSDISSSEEFFDELSSADKSQASSECGSQAGVEGGSSQDPGTNRDTEHLSWDSRPSKKNLCESPLAKGYQVVRPVTGEVEGKGRSSQEPRNTHCLAARGVARVRQSTPPSYRGRRKRCKLCDLPGHWVKDCPDLFCYVCKQQGHFAKECPEGGHRLPSDSHRISSVPGLGVTSPSPPGSLPLDLLGAYGQNGSVERD